MLRFKLSEQLAATGRVLQQDDLFLPLHVEGSVSHRRPAGQDSPRKQKLARQRLRERCPLPLGKE
jgi:hypothetical protein